MRNFLIAVGLTLLIAVGLFLLFGLTFLWMYASYYMLGDGLLGIWVAVLGLPLLLIFAFCYYVVSEETKQ